MHETKKTNRLSDQLRYDFPNRVEEFKKLKENPKIKDEASLLEKRKYAFLQFLLMKESNRLERYAFRATRERVQDEKVHVDSVILQLQNLLYEKNHLERESRNCYQFRSEDEDLNLLSSFEYATLLQESKSDYPPSTDRRALLENEIELRKQLSTQCVDLLESREEAFNDIAKKETRLSSLDPLLRNIEKAACPLQSALNVPLDKYWKLKKSVSYLPRPLYLSFMNMHALRAIYEAHLEVTVLGSVDEAKHMTYTTGEGNKRKAKSLDAYENDTNSKNAERTAEEQKLMFQAHPLIVQLSIGLDSEINEMLYVKFRYFPKLGFATAHTENNLTDSDAELVSATDLLKDLFVEDIGDEVPLADLEYKLTKVGLSSEDCIKRLMNNNLGRPYKWLQHICCIENYAEDCKKSNTIRKYTESIVTKVKSLWESRLKLLKEIRILTNKFSVNEDRPMMPKPSCSLVQWSCLKWEEYVANQGTSAYIALGAVKPNQSFYRSVIVRDSAKMECFISVSGDFPSESPIWVVCIYWNGEHNSTNNTAIKALEHWTNVMQQDELRDGQLLLQAQLIRTMYSFDIFLETEAPLYSPFEYTKEKHFIKAFSKRSRTRPYKLTTGGLFCALK